MKKAIFLCLPLMLGLTSFSCSILKKSTDMSNLHIIPQEEVVNFLSDSVCNVIFSDALVNVYKVETKIDSIEYSPDSLVCDHVIVKEAKDISKDLVSALQFILSDKKTYYSGEYIPSSPFIPGYLIEFVNNDKICRMLISISGGFCRLYWNDDLLQDFKYTQERLITYFLQITTEDEGLKDILQLQ